MAAVKKTVIREAGVKLPSGELDQRTTIGVPFDEVFNTTDGFTLKQFYENYLDFMTNQEDGNSFVYYGPTQPTNPKVKLWIDTTIQ